MKFAMNLFRAPGIEALIFFRKISRSMKYKIPAKIVKIVTKTERAVVRLLDKRVVWYPAI